MRSFVSKLNKARTYGKARTWLLEKGYKEIGNTREPTFEPRGNKPRFEKTEKGYKAHYGSEQGNNRSHYVVIFEQV